MHPHLFALGIEEGRCVSKSHDVVATPGAVAAIGRSAAPSVGARVTHAASESARKRREESPPNWVLMPPWRRAGRDAAAAIDETVTDVIRDDLGTRMSLPKSRAQSFRGNVGVDLRGG